MPETLLTSSKRFTITRVFDAPRAVIWNAWTDPEEAAHWWHPRGFTTPRETVSIEGRVGGRYRYTMISPEGDEYPTGGEILEYDEPERLVMTWGHPDRPDEPQPVLEIVLHDRGETTEMVFTVHGVDGAPGDGNVHDGWDSAFGELDDHLAG